jgi:hypothetical protein
MNLAMIRALDDKPSASFCWSLGYWPGIGAVPDTLMAPDSDPKDELEGVRVSRTTLPMTKTCPLPGGSEPTAVPESGSPRAGEAPVSNTGEVNLTNPCPNPRGDADSAVPGRPSRKPYRFTEEDRARSLERRQNRQLAETALTCDVCAAQSNCRAYKAGSVCTLTDDFKGFETKGVPDVIAKLKEIIAALETRAWQNAYFEKLDGGGADKNVTALFNQLMDLHLLLLKLYREQDLSKSAVVLDPNSTLGRIFGPQVARDESLPDSGDAATL